MIETIISNNCAGGSILHDLGMEFKTPTVNLQILPEEFPRFCLNLRKYMGHELKEYTEISQRHRVYINKMFGGVPDMPYGLLDDVIVCFQHYKTFDEAKEKWDERKKRIVYDNVGYLFHARGEEYSKDLAKFITLNLPHSLALAQNFQFGGAVSFYGEGFEAVNNKLRIVQVCDFRRWVNG